MKDVSLEITVSHRLIGPLVPNDLGSKTIKILSKFYFAAKGYIFSNMWVTFTYLIADVEQMSKGKALKESPLFFYCSTSPHSDVLLGLMFSYDYITPKFLVIS